MSGWHYLASITLLPAILVVVGPRGWIRPRRELTARFWRRSGIRIVRRPRAHLLASVLILVLLAGFAGVTSYNYDDREAVSSSAPSSIGYAALERHFDLNQFVPSYVLIQSPRSLRTPGSLADLEQMAERIGQLPDIGMVSGITRPLGEVPQEFRATYQAGLVGERLSEGSAMIADNMDDLDRLAGGADTLAVGLGDVRGQVIEIATGVEGMIEAFAAMRSQYGGEKLVRNVEVAAKLVTAINELGNSIGVSFTAARDLFAWVGPVLMALHGNVVCDLNPSCSETRANFQRLVDARSNGSIDRINDLAGNWSRCRTSNLSTQR